MNAQNATPAVFFSNLLANRREGEAQAVRSQMAEPLIGAALVAYVIDRLI